MSYEFDGSDLVADTHLPYEEEYDDFIPPIVIQGEDEVEAPNADTTNTWMVSSPEDRIEPETSQSLVTVETGGEEPVDTSHVGVPELREQIEPDAISTVSAGEEHLDEVPAQTPQSSLDQTAGEVAVSELVGELSDEDGGEQFAESGESSETVYPGYFAEATNDLGDESELEPNLVIEQDIQEGDSPEPLPGGGDDLDPPDDIPEGVTAEGDDNPDPLAEIITNDRGEFLGFRQPFDGNQPEISPDEQDAVKDAFRSFVRDTIETNDDSASLPYTPAEKFVNKYHTTVDGKEVAVMMDQRNVNLQGVREYGIHIQELQEGEWAGEGSHWIQYGENSVVRHDSELPPWTEQELSIIQGSGAVIHEYSYDPNDRANRVLAAALGFNDQPISMVEARSLFEVIERAMAQRKARRGQ